jgi:molybdopterin-guanine dinucleotide biosynthesis protein A
MGRDKALLSASGRPLAVRIASAVREAAGNVTLIGPVERYAHLGFPVIADREPGLGPLGGVYTALAASSAEWNLMVACDMPRVTGEFLRELLEAAEGSAADCVVPVDRHGPHPLCAAYHRRCAPLAESAIRDRRLKMQDFVASLRTQEWSPASAGALANVNTPAEWEAL